MGLLGLTASNGTTTGSVNFDGHELTGLPEQALNKVRGNNISMVFQDARAALQDSPDAVESRV